MLKRVAGAVADPVEDDVLSRLAGKCIWWKTPAEALVWPGRLIAQVMNIGDYDDVQTLCHQVGDERLRETLVHAEAGQFDKRSWVYWHLRLGLAAIDQIPPLPTRKRA